MGVFEDLIFHEIILCIKWTGRDRKRSKETCCGLMGPESS